MICAAYYGGLRDHILKRVGNAKSIVLFGSYRKGDDNDKSDIDIAVEVADDEEMKIVTKTNWLFPIRKILYFRSSHFSIILKPHRMPVCSCIMYYK